MRLTEAEVKLAISALATATVSERDLIECHRIGYGKDGERVIPKEYENLVRQMETGIRNMDALRAKLRQELRLMSNPSKEK